MMLRPLLLLTALVVGVQAATEPTAEDYVGLGDRCGNVNGNTYYCWPNAGLTCAAMPGQTQTICVKTAQEGEACNNEHTRCAAGLRCEIKPGQWAGVCKSGSGPSPGPAPPPEVSVGLGNQCGLIGGIEYVCRTDVGLTCATMPGQTQTICVKIAKKGEACNNEHTPCAAGLTCDIKPGQWSGTCK